jgi:hypothetical protein
MVFFRSASADPTAFFVKVRVTGFGDIVETAFRPNFFGVQPPLAEIAGPIF